MTGGEDSKALRVVTGRAVDRTRRGTTRPQLGAPELERATHAARLFAGELPHARVVGVVHVVVDRVLRGAGRRLAAAPVRSGLGVGIADDVTGRVAGVTAATTVEGVPQPEIVADLMCHRATQVVGRAVGSVATHRVPQHNDAITLAADDAVLGQAGDVAQRSAAVVAVDVEVLVRVPSERVVVLPAVVEPGVVGRERNTGSRPPFGIRGGQVELDHRVEARAARRFDNRAEVLVEDVDLALHLGRRDVALTVVVFDHVEDHGDQEHERRRVLTRRIRAAVGTIGRAVDAECCGGGRRFAARWMVTVLRQDVGWESRTGKHGGAEQRQSARVEKHETSESELRGKGAQPVWWRGEGQARRVYVKKPRRTGATRALTHGRLDSRR